MNAVAELAVGRSTFTNPLASKRLSWRHCVAPACALTFLLASTLAVAQVAVAPGETLAETQPSDTAADSLQPDNQLSEQLGPRLEEIRSKFGLPAIWAARSHVEKDGREVYFSAAAGIRKVDAAEKVTVDDTIHLGSCTKAMTALLIAQAVSRREIQWQDTLGKLLSENDRMEASPWRQVTVLDLMRQRSGCPKSTPWHKFHRKHPDNVVLARQAMVDWLLDQERPEKLDFEYSNLNYALLGHILEVKLGKSWETLIAARLFEPIGIRDFGFGPVGAPDPTPGNAQQAEPQPESEKETESDPHISHPWGHVVDTSIGKAIGRAIAAAASTNTVLHEHKAVQIDNAPPLGPAGRVHMPVQQWCKFIKLFLNEQAPTDLLGIQQSDWEMLTTPGSQGNYAGGWITLERQWADGLTLMHNGSNTTWYCVAWVAPKTNIINVAATNCYDPNVASACDAAIGALFAVAKPQNEQ